MLIFWVSSCFLPYPSLLYQVHQQPQGSLQYYYDYYHRHYYYYCYIKHTLIGHSIPLRVWKVILPLSYPSAHSGRNGCSVIAIKWRVSTQPVYKWIIVTSSVAFENIINHSTELTKYTRLTTSSQFGTLFEQ